MLCKERVSSRPRQRSGKAHPKDIVDDNRRSDRLVGALEPSSPIARGVDDPLLAVGPDERFDDASEGEEGVALAGLLARFEGLLRSERGQLVSAEGVSAFSNVSWTKRW